MTDTEPDRCGICPFTFGGWASKACAWHDKAYVKGSWHQQNLTREQVDRWFYTLLLTEAKKGKFQTLKHAQAYLMYKFVRAFGSHWWESNNSKTS